MIRRIVVVGAIGFLQLLRSRMYLNVIVAGVALVAVALGIDELSSGQGDRVLVNVGLALISVIVAVLAVVTGVGTVTKEIESKQIHLVLARPIHRLEIVLGRFLTVAALVVASNMILGAVLGATIFLVGSPDGSRAFVAAVYSSFEGCLVAALAIFFGTSSSATVSTLFTVTVFLLGRLSPLLHDLLRAGKFDPPLSQMLDGIYVALPHFFKFDLSNWARQAATVDVGEIVSSSLYGLAYVAALLAFASFKLERRDLL
jgi:ABC-type transport system involved in multi-copper enzyme maturation permease subunit